MDDYGAVPVFLIIDDKTNKIIQQVANISERFFNLSEENIHYLTNELLNIIYNKR